ncbi:MAG TPA: prepilin-type N-terminal cleavage/methylation domain-containing protein [Candidatus Sulfotelmatobacter sp.]
MKLSKREPGRGFTLVEATVAMAIGLIVLASIVSLFKTAMNSTMLMTQRAETQQNMRGAMDLMVKDISMAGAGLPSGGIQLPVGAVTKFGCDQTGTCHVATHAYPTGNYMYGIIPGYTNGVEGGAVIPAAPTAINDSITSIYCDYNFPLFEYTVTFQSPYVNQITLAPATGFTPPAINSNGGIQVGDLIMLSNTAGTEVGEVTTLNATTITFAALDPLNFNVAAGANTVASISGGSNTVAYRLYAVTYYLTVPGAGQTPRLMRQVNGLTPVPVADDIINLQFAYDIYNSTTNALDADEPNPLGVGDSPNNMQKINIIVMGESMLTNGNKSQNMYLATGVSARNMAFRNRYQ